MRMVLVMSDYLLCSGEFELDDATHGSCPSFMYLHIWKPVSIPENHTALKCDT